MNEITMIQSEIAHSLNISKARVNDLVKEHNIQGVMAGRSVAYTTDSINNLYESIGRNKKKKIITVNNIKGGVGKTMIARELGFSLAQQGSRVLMIDLDLQGTLSDICGVYNDELPTWKNIIKEEIELKELIIPLYKNLSIVPCNIGMGGIDREIGNKNIALLVKQYIDQVKNEYDVIILDTRPEVSNINLAAIIASDLVIVPAKADAGSQKGIRDTFREIELAEKEYSLYVKNKKIEKKILINLFKTSRNTELLKFSEINAEFGEFLHSNVLSDNNDMAKAYNDKKFLYKMKRISPINKITRSLATEILGINKPTEKEKDFTTFSSSTCETDGLSEIIKMEQEGVELAKEFKQAEKPKWNQEGEMPVELKKSMLEANKSKGAENAI